MSSAAGAYWKPAWTRNVTLSDGSLVEDSVVLPSVKIGRHVTVRLAIIDKRCVLPEGFTAGIDAEHDRARFHVATVPGPRCDGGIGKTGVAAL